MSALDALPLSRPVRVDPLPRDGLDVTVEASAEEREKLAAFNDLLGLSSLKAVFQLHPLAEGDVRVVGRLTADVVQSCVVTLDPVPAHIDAPIAVDFAPEGSEEEFAEDEDAPEPIVDGMIDLGRIAAEFLTLNLDPYPRKEGAVFEAPIDDEEGAQSRFSALAKGKKSDGPSG
jgi:uncharacterized metal-binding protein YceD (DUF177 family)